MISENRPSHEKKELTQFDLALLFEQARKDKIEKECREFLSEGVPLSTSLLVPGDIVCMEVVDANGFNRQPQFITYRLETISLSNFNLDEYSPSFLNLGTLQGYTVDTATENEKVLLVGCKSFGHTSLHGGRIEVGTTPVFHSAIKEISLPVEVRDFCVVRNGKVLNRSDLLTETKNQEELGDVERIKNHIKSMLQEFKIRDFDFFSLAGYVDRQDNFDTKDNIINTDLYVFKYEIGKASGNKIFILNKETNKF